MKSVDDQLTNFGTVKYIGLIHRWPQKTDQMTKFQTFYNVNRLKTIIKHSV